MKEKKFLDEVTTRVAYPASGGGYPLQMVRIVSPGTADILILY